MVQTSAKADRFSESVIREMTRRFLARGDKPGVNLAQGFPDFPAPEAMKEAACRAINADINQYAITWGSRRLRAAIADRYRMSYGMEVDPERHVTVACGATECMIAALMAVVNPGEEVIVFEPFYENYGPDAILSGAIPRFIRLDPPNWHLDFEKIEAAFNEKTRAIIINTPNNPTGKVFSREELEKIGELCSKWNVCIVTDEIYEFMTYGHKHIPMATLPGMAERTITISGLSKTFSATGWRIGWLIAPEHLSGAIRKVHDFLTVGAPAPLQEAAAEALVFGDEYFLGLSEFYRVKRELTIGMLRRAGFKVEPPNGAYYAVADYTAISDLGSTDFAMWLLDTVGIATVPGSSFYNDPKDGDGWTRFAFCKKIETLETAAGLLSGI